VTCWRTESLPRAPAMHSRMAALPIRP
jgi:hypothetical protein